MWGYIYMILIDFCSKFFFLTALSTLQKAVLNMNKSVILMSSIPLVIPLAFNMHTKIQISLVISLYSTILSPGGAKVNTWPRTDNYVNIRHVKSYRTKSVKVSRQQELHKR